MQVAPVLAFVESLCPCVFRRVRLQASAEAMGNRAECNSSAACNMQVHSSSLFFVG